MSRIKWTPRLVEAHLIDAADTMRCIPAPRPQEHYNGWPEILRDQFEMRGTAEGPPSPGFAVPSAVTQAEQTLLWFRWLDREDQIIVWQRANRRPWKAIEYDHGIERTTGWRRYKAALAVIAAHLNASERNNVATSRSATA